MAIVVEWAKSNLVEVAQLGDDSWKKRVDASKKYGYPLKDGLPTYPRELSSAEWVQQAVSNERHRSYLDGYQLYTLPGLLRSIYSYFELDGDYSNGVRSLDHIASVSIDIKNLNNRRPWQDPVEKEGCIKIPNSTIGKNARILLNRDGLMEDVSLITRSMARWEPPTHRILAKKIDATVNVYPLIKDISNRIAIAQLKIEAFNIPGLGDDMDDVAAKAIWKR